MDKPDKVTKAISALLFIAMLGYIGVYLWQSISDPVQTAIAISVTVQESATLSGTVIRDEQIITSSAAYIDVTAENGKRVAAGETIAVSYESDAALERAGRIRELELEIARMETLLSDLSTADDLTTRDTAVKNAVLSLSAAVAGGDLSELDSVSLNLRSLVLEDSDSSVSYEALSGLKNELNSHYTSSSYDTTAISAGVPGIYSSILDGFEHLSPDGLTGMTPAGVRALSEDSREHSGSAIGKLVTSTTWYYAAVADSGEIWNEDGSCRLTAGEKISLEFGRYYNTGITATVLSIGADVGGECVVIFSCKEALADTLAMRHAGADVIYAEYSGIRVPAEAIQIETDEDGNSQTYVYTLTATLAERKAVEVVYEGEGYVLVSESPDSDALKSGNEIIVSAKDLYDGKVMS